MLSARLLIAASCAPLVAEQERIAAHAPELLETPDAAGYLADVFLAL